MAAGILQIMDHASWSVQVNQWCVLSLCTYWSTALPYKSHQWPLPVITHANGELCSAYLTTWLHKSKFRMVTNIAKFSEINVLFTLLPMHIFTPSPLYSYPLEDKYVYAYYCNMQCCISIIKLMYLSYVPISTLRVSLLFPVAFNKLRESNLVRVHLPKLNEPQHHVLGYEWVWRWWRWWWRNSGSQIWWLRVALLWRIL